MPRSSAAAQASTVGVGRAAWGGAMTQWSVWQNQSVFNRTPAARFVLELSLLITLPASPLTHSYYHFPALARFLPLRLLHFHHPLPCASLSYSLGVFIFSLTGAMTMFGQDADPRSFGEGPVHANAPAGLLVSYLFISSPHTQRNSAPLWTRCTNASVDEFREERKLNREVNKLGNVK